VVVRILLRLILREKQCCGLWVALERARTNPCSTAAGWQWRTERGRSDHVGRRQLSVPGMRDSRCGRRRTAGAGRLVGGAGVPCH
jgi:hypothetical protein